VTKERKPFAFYGNAPSGLIVPNTGVSASGPQFSATSTS